MSGFHPHTRGGFIENTLEGLHFAMARALRAESNAGQGGALQQMDPRVKVAGTLALIVAVALSKRLWPIAIVLAIAGGTAILSAASIRALTARAWMGAFLFSGVLALPALFLTPGRAVMGLPVTWQGARTASFLVLRAEAAVTLVLLLVCCTPWNHILKALRIFRVPVVFVVILGMTCRYILLLLETAHKLFEARKSRAVNRLSPAENRRLAISSSGVLLTKTMRLSGDVYSAMQARGFRGEVFLLDDFVMRRSDWLAAAACAAATAALVLVGR